MPGTVATAINLILGTSFFGIALLLPCTNATQGCNGYFKVTKVEKPWSYDPKIFEDQAHCKSCGFGHFSESGELGEIDQLGEVRCILAIG